MHNPAPLALTLTFAEANGATTVRWEADALGVRQSRFASPFAGRDLMLVVRALDELQHPTAALAAAEIERLAALGLQTETYSLSPELHGAVGHALFRALTADPEGAMALRQARDSASYHGRALALQLRFPPTAVELAALPWELLWGEREKEPLLLSRGRVGFCTRHLDLADPIPLARPRFGPLRILSIVPHARQDAAARHAERATRLAAWQPLLDSGMAVMLPEVSPATPSAIVDAFQAGAVPDIVHYVGHGAYRDGEGFLLLDREGGGFIPTPASRLLSLFGDVRLAVLTSCQGAMVDAVGAGLLSGVALALSAVGVPFVVGMQLTVSVRAANRAAAVIYRALAQGKSVQEAVGDARQALFAEENDRASWYIPTLYIRSRDTGPAFLAAQASEPTRQPARQPTSQVIVATKRATVSGAIQEGGGGSQQTIRANGEAAVRNVAQRASDEREQRIGADEGGEVSDVRQEGDSPRGR